jgi:hypothetical protein
MVRALPRRVFITSLGSGLVASAVPAFARPEAPLPALPLSIAVAVEGGRPVRDDAWIDAQIAEAQRLYDPLGVHFHKAAQRTLAEPFARLETRKDRDALDAERRRGVVNVFVVAALRDVDDPRLYRKGVHWRNGRTPAHRYVIVSADAAPSTLAHELGHYDGLAHVATLDNLMSYNRSGERVFLDARQAGTVRTFARLAFASGELVALPAAPAAPAPGGG